MQDSGNNMAEYIHATSALTFATALALLEIDRLPLEDRTTHRIASYLEAYGIDVAGRLPDGVSGRLLQMIARLLQSVEEMGADDQWDDS